MKKRILVVDDDAVACEFLEETLKRDGYDVTLCSSAWEALRQNIASYNLVMSDIRMSGMDGLQLLEKLQKQSPDLPVILMTAYGSLETTMAAVNKGAWDYISKPFSPEDCRTLVRKVLELRKFRHKGMKLQPVKVEESKFIGSSAMMVDFYKQIARIADSSASVLIEGESGTGKELTARSLHNMSSRREKPFIIVHCGAIPDNLLESELFGYNKGAYTGASHQHTGLLETAEGGTVFLDEITEMSTALQGKLLRFMQNGEIRKIGDNAVRNVEVRVVAAANKKIDDEVKKENFRLNLLYRFIVRLRIPPLRKHKEDIPLLTEALLKKLGDTNVSVSPDAMEMFMAYDWPGNVRELENVLQQIMLLSPFDEILPENLPECFHHSTGMKDTLNGSGLSPLEEAEKEKILQTLEETSWNQHRAAKRLDIDRKTLRTKIRRYSLS